MIVLAAAAAFLAHTSSVPDNIDIAEANWESYPRLETAGVALPNSDMVRRVELLLQNGECQFEGQEARRFYIDVNYAVRLDPQGNATQIVVQDVGCRSLEMLVGQIAAKIVAEGHVRTPAPSRPTLYASRINFNLS